MNNDFYKLVEILNIDQYLIKKKLKLINQKIPDKTIAYIYNKLEKASLKNRIHDLARIEKYCKGIEVYNGLLMQEAELIMNELDKISLIPSKGYFLNKYMYKSTSIREMSDIDFICLDSYKSIIINYMKSKDYIIVSYNDESDLTLPLSQVKTMLLKKEKDITIKLDFMFIDIGHPINEIYCLSNKQKNPINEYSLILYLILLAYDMKKKNENSLNIMKQIDISNFFRMNHSISIKKINEIIQHYNDPYKCSKISNFIKWEEITYE